MPSLDERLRRELDRLAVPQRDPAAFEHIARRRIKVHRRRVARTVALTAGSVAVVGVLVVTAVAPSVRTIAPGRSAEAPANGRIAYTSADGVHLVDPDGEGDSVVFAGDASDVVFSPDGTKLAAERGGDIWVMDADGSRARAVADAPDAIERGPAWSPDGKRLAFVRYTPGAPIEPRLPPPPVPASGASAEPRSAQTVAGPGSSTIDIVDVSGGARVHVSTPPGFAADAAWSPDGRELAFAAGSGLYIADAATGSVRDLGVFGGRGVAWSPDGAEIAYSTSNDLWVAKADGSHRRRVAREGALPSWSPDARRILFRKQRQGESYVVISRHGGAQRPVVRGAGSPAATWSPDGRLVAYRTYRGDVNVAGMDGSRTRTVVRGSAPGTGIAWQNVGGRFVVASPASQRRRTAVVVLVSLVVVAVAWSRRPSPDVPPAGVRLRYLLTNKRVPPQWLGWVEHDVARPLWRWRNAARYLIGYAAVFVPIEVAHVLVTGYWWTEVLGPSIVAGVGLAARLLQQGGRYRMRFLEYQRGNAPNPQAPRTSPRTAIAWMLYGLLAGGLLSLVYIVLRR